MFNLTSICPQHFITLICRSWSYTLHSVTDDVIVVMFVPHTMFCQKAEGVDQKVGTSFGSDLIVGTGQASGEDRKVCVCVCVGGGGGGETFKTNKQTKRVIILLQNKPSTLFLLVPRLKHTDYSEGAKTVLPPPRKLGGGGGGGGGICPRLLHPCPMLSLRVHP